MSRMRWADTAEDDFENMEMPLPEPQTLGPDEKGIKTVIEFRRGEKNEIIKTTRRYKRRKELKTIHPEVIRRRALSHFGRATSGHGNLGITAKSIDNIPLERTRNPEQDNGEDSKTEDLKAALEKKDASKVVGNLKEMLYKRRMERKLMEARGLLDVEKAPEEEAPIASSTKGGYVPPQLRGEGRPDGDVMQKRRDENSIRVTNLSEDTREQDLHELFGPFGQITRIYLARDRETNESRGFAFINFTNREDAQRALNRLDGHGYDNLILRVEWAAPRSDRQ